MATHLNVGSCTRNAARVARPFPFHNNNITNASVELLLPKDAKMRTVVGVSCCLSILGSLLIILSYILFKKRRTRAREILLHISLMDLGVALANLIGLSVYFDRYYAYHFRINPSYEVPAYIEGLCKTQAFFATYCMYASVLWTIALAGFLYFLIIYQKSKIATYFLWSSYVICYAVPLLVTMWLATTNRLGYSPYDSSGWCSLIVTVSLDFEGVWHRNIDMFLTILGYNLWVYLAFVTIPMFYLSIRYHLAGKVKEIEQHITSKKLWSYLNHIDYKFLFIPIVFVFLRIWSVIQAILYDYMRLHNYEVNSQLTQALFYLSGIGDSSQDFANAIIFVIFTKNIRDSFIRCICCRKRSSTDNLEEDGQIQDYSDHSHLISINSDGGDAHEVDERVFGTSTKAKHSGAFKKYGAVS